MSQASGNGKGNRTGSANQNNRGAGCLVALFIVGFFVLPLLWSLYDEGVFTDADEKMETAPVFGPQAVGRLVEQLDRASDAQGVCYGWVIDSGRSKQVKTVPPSYPGTFRPDPSGTPGRTAPSTARPSPTTRPSSPAVSPGVRPTPTGARPTAPGTSPVPTAPRTSPVPGAPGSPGTERPGSRTTPAPLPSERVETLEDLGRLDDGGVEYGSNLGPGIDPRQVPERCPKWIVLDADYSYSSEDQEFTYGTFRFKYSWDRGKVFTNDFDNMLAQQGEDDMDGPNAAARLRDTIGAMPMLVAEEGLAPPVPAPTRQAAAPPADHELAESTFSSRNIFTGIGIALIAGGVVWIAVAAVRNRKGTSS